MLYGCLGGCPKIHPVQKPSIRVLVLYRLPCLAQHAQFSFSVCFSYAVTVSYGTFG